MAALANSQKRLSGYEAVAGKTRTTSAGFDRATIFVPSLMWPLKHPYKRSEVLLGPAGSGTGGPVIGSRIIRGLGAL